MIDHGLQSKIARVPYGEAEEHHAFPTRRQPLQYVRGHQKPCRYLRLPVLGRRQTARRRVIPRQSVQRGEKTEKAKQTPALNLTSISSSSNFYHGPSSKLNLAPLGSEVAFKYGTDDLGHYNRLSDFAWRSSTTGSNNSFNSDGGYYDVRAIDGLPEPQNIKRR